MSTIVPPYSELLQRSTKSAVKAVETWSKATGDIVGLAVSTPESFAASVDNAFDTIQRALDLQHEAITDLVATTTGTVDSIFNALAGAKSWQKLVAQS